MSTSWLSQILGTAIYVQTIGAFVWLFVVVLLERHRRRQGERLQLLEALFHRQGQTLNTAWRCVEELQKQVQLIRPTSPASMSDHEETDPAFRLPSGIDNPRPESPAIDDEPASSSSVGVWRCNGCRQRMPCGRHGERCLNCGGQLELEVESVVR